MTKHLLGIDLGTSGVRAGVFREDGTCLGTGSRSYSVETPSPGHAEQNPEAWWKSTCESIAEALERAGFPGGGITAVSFSGQMHGTVLLDDYGEPVIPAVIWADTRSADECREIEEALGAERLEKILMNRVFPGTQAATLFWLRKHRPETWRRVRRVLTPKDYIRFRMCGLFNTEPSDASATLLFDVPLREWSDEILKVLGLPVEFLPYVVNSDQHVGETENIEDETGIPDGVPVVMGGGDQPCTALGNGVLDEGSLLVTVGTGGQLFAPSNKPVPSPGLALNTFCHLPGSRWYVMGATLSAGMSLAWFRDTFSPGTDYGTLTAEASRIPPGADGLMFAPYLAGRRSPELDPLASGAFTGVRLDHTRGHFVRAVLEGVTFELKENLEVMNGMGLVPKTAVLSGGAAKSRLWTGILADVFNLPVTVPQGGERACLGAAMVAGIGTGVYGSWHEAAEAAGKPGGVMEPNGENSAFYAELFGKFKRRGRE